LTQYPLRKEIVMKVRDLMTSEVITVGREASLKEAARRMIEAGVSGLVVTDSDGTLKGVVTEADFVKAESDRRADKRARLLRWFLPNPEIPSTERLVGDVMTAEVITTAPNADHAEAARIMRKAGVKRVPVVDQNGRLLGILSRSDILRAFARPDGDIISEIKDHILGEVLWIDPKSVDVTSTEGNVTLAGKMETKSDAMLVEEMTRRIDGVVSVASKLTWEVDNTKLEMAPPIQGAHRTGPR
jgi:CBS domain-containing protein